MSTATPDLSDFKADTQDMSDFKADSPVEAAPPPSAASRFWSGVKAGTGGENALNTPVDPNNPIATNAMIPGAGVYRDLKAGNYAGAAGRVAGPAAQLLPMLMGGASKVPSRALGTLPETGALPASQTGEALGTLPQPKIAAEPPQAVPVGQLPLAKGNPYAGPRTPQNMQVAQSTNIGLHGYEPNSQTMMVQFANGRVYEYRGVPKEVYDNFTNSESQGSFFAQQIKGRYTTNFRGTVKPSAGAQARKALEKP